MKTSGKKYVIFSEIKQKVSITDVLEYYGLLGRFRQKASDVFIGFCPLCRAIHARHFKVEPYKSRWYCFKCKEGGDILSLVSKIEKVSIRKAGLLIFEWFKLEPKQKL